MAFGKGHGFGQYGGVHAKRFGVLSLPEIGDYKRRCRVCHGAAISQKLLRLQVAAEQIKGSLGGLAFVAVALPCRGMNALRHFEATRADDTHVKRPDGQV
jgi:hypothetical protein